MPTISMCATFIKGTPEDKEKLPQIIKEHKEWLEDHTKGRRACLRDMNLEGVDLSGEDLSLADFSGSYLAKAKMVNTKLTGAIFDGASLSDADLTRADLNGAQMSHVHMMHACLEDASLHCVIMRRAVLWESNFKRADLKGAVLTCSELCDCTFELAEMECADLDYTNLDNTVFNGANLSFARIKHTTFSYYADFLGADVTNTDLYDCDLDEESFAEAIGFHPYMRCPEEGSFIAWKKCRDDHIVKLLIPETAERTGASVHNCRASEAKVLEIWNPDNEPCDTAVSCADEDFIYRKGEMVYPREAFDAHLLTSGSGIHFFLTRAEAEQYTISCGDDDDSDDDFDEDEEEPDEKTDA